MRKLITVLLVNDHSLVRTAIKQLLSKDEDIKVVDDVSSGQEALQSVREYNPDVIILDLSMPGMSGLETTYRLLRLNPKAKIIILTSYLNDFFVSLLLKAGASGYLTKQANHDELIKAIHSVMRGERYIYEPLAQQLAIQAVNENLLPFMDLSSREIEILWMICRGETHDQIAKELFLSKKTVHAYRYSLFKKLHVNSDVELTRITIANGFFEF